MTNKEKQELPEKLKALYKNGDLGEIINTILSSAENPDDPELPLIAVRAMLDLAELSVDSDYLIESAACILEEIKAPDDQTEYKLLSGRAKFLMERYISACKDLIEAKQIDDAQQEPAFTEELDELIKVCHSEVAKLSAVYKKQDFDLIISHIEDNFGMISAAVKGDDFVDCEELSHEFRLYPDILIIEPFGDRKWRTFITIGAGAWKMNIPSQLSSIISPRSEYVMYLPADWKPSECEWAVNLMANVALLPRLRNSFATIGHIFSDGMPLTKDTELMGTMLIDIQDCGPDANIMQLTDGSELEFYQLFPVYREEFEYKLENGFEELINKMPHISPVYDLHRENVCKSEESNCSEENVLLAPEYDYTGKLGVGIFCAVSRRILEEGMPVGYMRRFYPDSDQAPSDTDSGWLFLSGTESPGSLTMPTTITIARLNTVCNIDPGVIPHLEAPYNSIFVRTENGRFKPVLPERDEKSLPLS